MGLAGNFIKIFIAIRRVIRHPIALNILLEFFSLPDSLKPDQLLVNRNIIKIIIEHSSLKISQKAQEIQEFLIFLDTL